MECNKVIKKMLSGDIRTTENLFGAFCLFANGLSDIDTVMRIAFEEKVNFAEELSRNNIDFKLVVSRK